MNTKKRIEWVDVVKGMAIPLVIIGHTAQSEAWITYIYSFHMPLFFLLSGYTSKRATDVKTYLKHIWRDFCHLLLPCIIVQWSLSIFECWMKVQSLARFEQLLGTVTKGVFYRVYWGCAWGWANGSPSVGMLWFFITMFWGKVIWEGIGLLFPKGDVAVCIFVALIGIWYGPDHYLPQNLDIAMMVVLYYTVGSLVRKYQEQEIVQKLRIPAFGIALCFWLFCAQQGIYVELAVKSYPGIVAGILASICGSYVFCILGQEITQNLVCKKVFSLIGKHTLLIVLIHYMDSLLEDFWTQDEWMMSVAYRSVVVLGISAGILLVRSIVSYLINHLKKAENLQKNEV
jgi:fucose 4-O-acetylase-like acetyltransferase